MRLPVPLARIRWCSQVVIGEVAMGESNHVLILLRNKTAGRLLR